MRKTQLSVTNFLYCGNEYLFMHRSSTRKVDAGKLNGIGGKLEKGEDYLSAAIRETKEETGYIVTQKDMQLSGIVHLHGGYKDDWVMAFFKIHVATKKIPLGVDTREGKLLWLPANKLLTSGYELVDDLYYCWDKILAGKEIFFVNAQVNSKEKIEKYSISALAKW